MITERALDGRVKLERLTGPQITATNLSTNPNAVSAIGFSSNNGALYTVTRNVAVTGPYGGGVLTTAAQSVVATGAITTQPMSMYNVDSLANSSGIIRWVGAWVTVNTAGYQVRWNAEAWIPLTANTWTFIPSTSAIAGDGYASMFISTVSGANAPESVVSYVTGVTVSSVGPVTDAIWGSRPASGGYSYAWSGTANASTSVRTGVVPVSINHATNLRIRRGGSRSGLGIQTDVGLMSFRLYNDEDPMNAGTYQPGQTIRALATPDVGAPVAIFTGRVVDVDSSYPLNKQTGERRTYTTITVADAVKVHTTTPRYGVVVPAPGFETFEDRIQRLSASAQAAIVAPTVGGPREVYAL